VNVWTICWDENSGYEREVAVAERWPLVEVCSKETLYIIMCEAMLISF